WLALDRLVSFNVELARRRDRLLQPRDPDVGLPDHRLAGAEKVGITRCVAPCLSAIEQHDAGPKDGEGYEPWVGHCHKAGHRQEPRTIGPGREPDKEYGNHKPDGERRVEHRLGEAGHL